MSSETLHCASFVFSLRAHRRREVAVGILGSRVLSSPLILCESALLELPSRISPPFTLSKGKRASSVQTLSCNGAQLTEILLPGHISVTLAVCVGGESARAFSSLTPAKRGVLWQRSCQRWPSWERSAAGNVDLEASQVEQSLNN